MEMKSSEGGQLNSSASCLFCCSEVKVKLNLDASTSLLNEDENCIPSKGSDDCDFLRPHLQSLFILRSLLEISEEQCAQYLELQTLNDIATGDHNESQSHPASWFSLCRSCAPIVRESFHVHKEIQKLSGKLQELKRKLRDLIIDSGSGRKQRILKRRLGSNLQNVCFQVREKILDQELAHRPQLNDPDIDAKIDSVDFDDDANWDLDGLLDFENVDDDDHDHDDFQDPEVSPLKKRIQRKRSSPRSKPKRKRKKKSATLNEVKIKKPRDRPRVDPSKPRRSHCKICPAIFKTEHSLKSHEKFHTKGGGHSCDLCQHLFRTQRRLDIHMKRHERFLNLKSKVRHKYHYISQRAWNSRIPFYCRFNGCHMIFSRLTKFVKHAEYYHPSEMIPVKCSEADCDKMFETEQILEMHRKWEHLLQQDDINESKLKPHNDGDGVIKVEVNADDGTYETDKIVCPHCSDSAEEFPSVGERDFHIAEKHPDVLRTCPICGDYRAEKFYSLLNHIQTTHLGETAKVQCDLCWKTFNKGGGIIYHRQEVHYKELGLERIWCEVCQLNFPSQQFLLRHKEQVHENLRPHCCEHCGKTFKTPYCLKRHITLHTAPRELQHYKKGPFFCQYCSYQCNVRQSLFYHMKKLHNDKFEFKCERCGQGYCTQNKLHKHAQHCKK